MAVDRGNEKVAYLYEPGHPAILQMVKRVIEDAHRHNIWVGMCGEMSGEPLFAILLLGLGLDEFSMPPPRVTRIKELLRNVRQSDAQKVAQKALSFVTAREVEKYLQAEAKKLLGSNFDRFIV